MENTSRMQVATTHVYPGWAHCNRYSPHALWHQQTADALTDLVLAVDKVLGLL